MQRIIFLCFIFFMGFIIPNTVQSQAEKYAATQFAVRIFSSANFMGYLEPCG